MHLSIIIVNYNVKYFLEQCLYSVVAAPENITVEIIVADNNSSDGSIDYLKPKFPQVNFLKLNKNLGFARANNYAVSKANGDYILFLNPDTILPGDILQNCLSFLNAHEEAGAVGVRMIDGSGSFLSESKRSIPTLLSSFYKFTGLAKLFPASRFNKYALGYLKEKEVHEVDVLSGAFFMIKKAVLDKTGLFDDRFFMYGEDIDLSYRIQKAGYKNYYLGNTAIIHFKGESTNKMDAVYVRSFYGAMQLFVKKHKKGLQVFFLKDFISIAAFAVSIKYKLYNFFQSKVKKEQNAVSKILLAGSEATSCSNAKNILKQLFPNINIQTSGLEHLNISSINSAEIIFCLYNNEYKTAIDTLSSIPKNIPVKFTHQFSQSIVGSSNKNKYGEVYFAADNSQATPIF